MNLSPLPTQKFFDNNGRPLAGGLLFTYASGTSTPQATYTDQSGMTPHMNPIVLDFRGEAEIWLDINLTYKFILSPANDTDPPTHPIWSVDDIAAPVTLEDLTQQVIGLILYPRTAAEITAGVTPVNYSYPPGHLYRYGSNASPGTTDMSTALQAAVNQMISGGASIDLPAGDIRIGNLVTGEINVGFKVCGAGIGRTHLLCSAAIGLFDLTATASSFNQFTFEGFTVVTDTGTATASGIKVTSGGAIPSITMRDVMVLTDGAHIFSKPVHLVNCGENFFERVFIYGTSSVAAAIYIITSGSPGSAAAVNKFVACSIYNAINGVELVNTTNPGLEGIQFYGCDIVGVVRGVVFSNSIGGFAYFTPQICWIGGHINASVDCLNLTQMVQLTVQGALFYNSGSTGNHIKLTDVGGVNIQGTQFITVAGGCDAIAMSAGGTINGGIIAGNYAELGAGKAIVNLVATNFQNLTIERNKQIGGNASVVVSGTMVSSITIRDNDPQDADDLFFGATTAVATSLSGCRSDIKLVQLSTPGGATTITSLTGGRSGQIVNLQCSSNLVTIQHNGTNPDGFILFGGVNFTYPANGAVIQLVKANGGYWTQIA